MSKKFNVDDYKGKYVMHCKTEEEAKDFCRVLHEAGRKWSSGDSYAKETYWNVDSIFTTLGWVGSERYYYFNEGTFSIKPEFCTNHTILEWSDFMDKEFTLSDLKNFDIVLRRDGDVRILIGEYFIDKNGCMTGPRSRYYQDLCSYYDNDEDIVAIIRPVTIEDMSFDAFEKKLGRLVYERDE